MTLTLRQESDSRATTKGSSLTFAELDNNFIDLANRASLIVEDDTNTQFTIATETPELKVTGSGGLSTAVTQDSSGAVVLTLTQGAGSGGIGDVVGGTNINITEPDSTGSLTVNLDDTVTFTSYKETVHHTNSDSAGDINIDPAEGTIHEIYLQHNVTFTGFQNPSDGQSVTLILCQDATGSRTFTESLDSAGSMLFAGGTSTLSTAAYAKDIMTIVYAGGIYYASLATNFS